MDSAKYNYERAIVVGVSLAVSLFVLFWLSTDSKPTTAYNFWGGSYQTTEWVFDPAGFIIGLLVAFLTCFIYQFVGFFLSNGLSELYRIAYGKNWETSTTILVAAAWPLALIPCMMWYLNIKFFNETWKGVEDKPESVAKPSRKAVQNHS